MKVISFITNQLLDTTLYITSISTPSTQQTGKHVSNDITRPNVDVSSVFLKRQQKSNKFILFCVFGTVYLFIHSLIHSFIHLLTHSFIHSFIHSFMHSFIYAFIHSFIYAFIHLFIYAFIHLFIHSSIHLCIHSFIHSFINHILL